MPAKINSEFQEGWHKWESTVTPDNQWRRVARTKTVCAFLTTLLCLAWTTSRIGEACTVGVVNGRITRDGRPILWKVRDTPAARQQLVFVKGDPHDYVGIRSEGEAIYMGLNEAGLASGNSLIGRDDLNGQVQMHVLEKCGSVSDVERYIREGGGERDNATGCFPIIDALGNAVLYEVAKKSWWFPYDSINGNRRAQGTWGFVVRANEFHRISEPPHCDNTGIAGRYRSGALNVAALADKNKLGVAAILRGDSDPGRGHEVVRYGPGRSHDAIARDFTQSAFVAQGVLSDEDPRLSTAWVILGQPNFGIAVPAWVMVADVPDSLASGALYDLILSLYRKGGENATQQSIFPMEAHIFAMVNERILPEWRGMKDFSKVRNDAHRVEHRITDDARSLLECLVYRRQDNAAPQVDVASRDGADGHGPAVGLTLMALDVNGSIARGRIDFGDGTRIDFPDGVKHKVTHEYPKKGRYLISFSAQDDDGVWNTAWRYIDAR